MQNNDSYQKNIHRACDYVQHHLNHDLSLTKLSEVACCSKFHFHRIFVANVGISLTKYIQLLRLKRASFRLAFEPDKRIIDIALEATFESPEAFSRAFKRLFLQSPSQFRRNPNWLQWHDQFDFNLPKRKVIMKVNIIQFKPQPVAMLAHRGDPKNVLDTAGKFIAWRKESGLSPVKHSHTYGIPYSDPNTTPAETFRFDICGSLSIQEQSQGIPENQYGVIKAEIPGGRCAVIRHQGSHANLDHSVYYLYQQWLPDSGEELRDFPCFFQYINLIHEVDECDLLTDIYLPLK